MSSRPPKTTASIRSDRDGDDTPGTVQLLVADSGNRTAIRKMLSEYFTVETSQTVRDADLYLIEDHLFSEYHEALRERIERVHPVFCPIVVIRRQTTALAHPAGETSSNDGPILIDDVVDAPVDRSLLIRRLHSLLVRRRQSQELSSHVSTLEKREQELRRFERGVESTSNGIVLTGRLGEIDYVNPEFEKITGYAESEVLGETPRRFQPEGAADVFTEAFWRTMIDREEWAGEVVIEHSDETRSVVDTSITAIHDDGGDVEGFVIVLNDITERIQQEQELLRREEELDLLRQILTRYLRHNLRNDLNVILGYGQMLASDETLSDRQVQMVEKILEMARRLQEKSDTARQFSTLLQQNTELSSYDLSEIVRESVQMVSEQYPDAAFDLDVPETCEIRAREGIRDAVEELIENAAEHAETASPHIHIQLRNSNGVRLVIEDDGPGISELELATLEEGEETPLSHSQGIGLWLSKWAIESVDGQLSFDRLDSGTRVTVEFSSPEVVGSKGLDVLTLKERDQRLQTAIDRMTDAIIEVNAVWEITFADARAEKIFDVSADEIAETDFWDVFSDTRDTQFEAVFRDVMDSRTSQHVEAYYPGIDGWLSVYVYPEFDGGLSLYVRDTTERNRREQELQQAQSRMELALRLTDAIVWEQNVETDSVTVHPKTSKIFKSEVTTESEFLDAVHTEDRVQVQEALEATIKTETPYYAEYRVQRDGDVRWIEDYGELQEDEDGSKRLIRVARDITDRLDREQALKDLYDITADRDASFTEQVQQLLALGRREFGTEYGSLSKITGDEYRFEAVAADDDSIQAGDVVPLAATNCELVASRTETIAWGDIARDAPEQTDRAGYTEWGISCYLGAPVYDNDGVYGTFCFYGTDTRAEQFSEWEVTFIELMSRWVSYELQRKQVTEQLQRQNDRLEQFASIVSHDLRNPLNIMAGRLELAEDTGDPEEFARCFDALERMEALIDDLLTLSKAGDTIDDVEPVELRELAELAWASVPTEDATLQLTAHTMVPADASRLQQLLENLFRNAIEHGGEDVTVTVGALEHGFYVEDDGPGIPDEHRDDIFEHGYSTTTDGTGFGLAIVADIVEAHGWEIQVTGGEGGGARFEITGTDAS